MVDRFTNGKASPSGEAFLVFECQQRLNAPRRVQSLLTQTTNLGFRPARFARTPNAPWRVPTTQTGAREIREEAVVQTTFTR
ncbi:MAG TPA: hypothetical protein VF598_10150 [Hymenobacter sp.]